MDFQHREKMTSHDIKTKELEIAYLQSQLAGLPHLNIDMHTKTRDILKLINKEDGKSISLSKNKISSIKDQSKEFDMTNVTSSVNDRLLRGYNKAAKNNYSTNKRNQISYELNKSTDDNDSHIPKFYLSKEAIVKG